MASQQPRGVQQGAVPTDGDDQFGPRCELLLRTGEGAVGRESQAHAGVDQGPLAAGAEMAREAQHALGNAQILGVADERDGFERLRHRRTSL